MQIDPTLAKELKKVDLRYVSDSNPGIIRKHQNNTFIYFDSQGNRIQSEQVLERIKTLAIPPAWSDVWICPSPNGYLQATGMDDKKRKQYIYHEDWRKLSQENKFNKMIEFGELLPKIRKRVSEDMAADTLERNKIIATVIWLLGETMIRIGNDEYAKENNSFGLTTLRNKHVKIRGKQVTFEFVGKSGIQHTVKISHPRIVKIIKEIFELPGYELFQYIDDAGQRQAIDSSDINKYLQELTDEDITAKDFRTWGATTRSALELYTIGPSESEEQIKSNITKAVKKVAKHLRNTAKVCRSYYIHPTIIKSYENKTLIPHFDEAFRRYKETSNLTKDEYATLSLLKKIG